MKTENAFKPYNGTIDFGRDSNNPGDTNWAFSNALLGNYLELSADQQRPACPTTPTTTSNSTARTRGRVSSRLTLNYGLRVAFIKPFHDNLGLMSNFDPSKYDQSQAVVFYQPYGSGCQSGRR